MLNNNLEIPSFSDTRVFSFNSEISTTISLGSGYDSRTKTVKNLVAEGTVDKEIKQNTDGQYIIDWCENYSEMASFFGLAASASYSGASGGISASINIMRSTAIESSRIYIAARVYIIANVEFYPDARLKENPLSVLNSEPLPSFSEKYGGTYARSIFRGGELACVMEISASQNETIEELRAAMSAHGWGAKTEAEMEQSLRELTRTRSVVVRYCQSGGSIGSVTSGIIVTNAEGLIERMKQFIPEVWGTNGLDGNTVPLRAELEKTRSLTNWPSKHTGDPDRPYPNEIENVARSALLLKDKLVFVEDLLKNARLISPSANEMGKEIFPYLQFVVAESTMAVEKMVRGASPQLDFSIESFFQYRIRRFLNVNPGIHANAGQRANLGNTDPGQFLEQIFGRNIPTKYEKWPKLSIQDDWWGYQGQEPGMFPKVEFHVICPQHGGSMLDVARGLAGNPGPDSGVFVHASASQQEYFGGNACGYSPVYALAIKVEKPAISELPPLPALPDDVIDTSTLSISKIALEVVNKNEWRASFALSVGNAGSCGRYQVIVKEANQSDIKIKRTRSFISYWLEKVASEVQLTHDFAADAQWKPEDFTVIVERAFQINN